MKKLFSIFVAMLVVCLVCTNALAAQINLEPEVMDNGTVAVEFRLDAVPSDIKDVSAISIRYTYDTDKLEYVSTLGNGDQFKNLIATAGNIVWFDETFDSSKAITAQKLAELDGLMFTLNFKKVADAYGTTDIELTFVELAGSDFAVGQDVEIKLTTIELGEKPDDGTGDDNTGSGNTGDDNTGSGNTGDDNTGSDNTGDDNTGSGNTGDDNTGSGNTGDDNTGSDNTGDDNTGSDNTGDDNTGDDNTGSDNTGDDNTGSGNTGSDNTGNGNGSDSGSDSGSGNGSNNGSNNGSDNGSNNGSDSGSDSGSDKDSGGTTGGNKVSTGGGSFGGTSTPKPPQFAGFADIPNDNWGYAHTYSLMQKGIIAGDGAAKPAMRPNDNLTRAEAAKIALLAMGVQPEQGLTLEFSDASAVAPWAVPYIATAVKYGLITGYSDGSVGANDNITREQMLTILARAMKWQVKDGELKFTDAGDISDWAKPGVAYAVELGVMKGYEDGSVRPKANITRIEVFALVDRCLK